MTRDQEHERPDESDDWIGRHDADVVVPVDEATREAHTGDSEGGPLASAAPPEVLVVTERCAVCLQTPDDPVLLHACYHVFCLACIGYWARHLASMGVRHPTCPLCKRSFQRALVDVLSETQYTVLRFDDGGKQWRERQSERRLRPALDERLLRRSMVYRQRLRLVRVQDVVVDPSAPLCPTRPVKVRGEYEAWARRELRACVGPDADLSFLMVLLDGALVNGSLHETLEPFLLEDTALFVRELTWFLASRLQVPAYDDVLVYSDDGACDESECNTTN
ncbi:hypothetical protein ATCC90586_003095 [Pythium insidiosum]|nr:hypothetical protein ATCC90586_003095 [Pythium insidiosum]